MLLGATLASYEINHYLFELSKELRAGDCLIIGNSIRDTNERLVNAQKYKSEIFDKWLSHLPKSLGFTDEEIEYDVRFGNSRFEAYYKLKEDKTIIHNNKTLELKKGDEMLVGVLYKYYKEEFQEICDRYFTKSHVLANKENNYALTVCVK